MLEKKAALAREKAKTICLTKRICWIVIKIWVFYLYFYYVFFIINYNKQELIYHIHCFEYIFYHQSMTKESCWFHKFLFYDLYFESYALNVSNISYSTKHLYIYYDLFLFTPFVFLCSLLSSAKYEYIFGFNPTNSSIGAPANSCFFYQSLITKVKHFFIVAKISLNFRH